jgi:hypothetical protein
LEDVSATLNRAMLAANTFLKAFVKYRHAKNMASSVVDIGLVGDIGCIGEYPSVFEGFRAAGSHFVYEVDVLNSLTLSPLS